MSFTRTQETILQELLNQCGTGCRMQPGELAAIHEHLFDQGICLPFVQDADLHETIFYLSQLIAEKKFVSLNDLAIYNDRKKSDLRNYLQNMMEETASPVSRRWFVRFLHDVADGLHRSWQGLFCYVVGERTRI